MKSLFKSIVTKYNDASDESVALRAALTNGLYCYEAPQNTDFPYGVFFLVSDIPWDRFVERGNEAVIQFNIFSRKTSTTVDPLTEISNLYELLDAVYDECTLTIDNYTHVSMKRELGELIPGDESGVYQCSISYRVLMEKV